MKNVLIAGICLWVAACVAEPDPATTEATPELSSKLSPELSSPAVEDPDLLVVFECSLDGWWYATRAQCVESCTGGTCGACGQACQHS